ncbi:hypothetical protein Kisp01_70600 [Kineosporia sp. NBRC 101677]|uniref:VirB4 family type IV secretion system protein n=1 Tax=Kineosporia sp. NBRC 101677 TaxID=3032197 RepID=UPI0024A0A8BD|nr:DUF87 domain-containing protein [Kineosporia sp. NBRC 101677]GLY20046.1 hypothetical protein Kisp01_70600 [Kineosporia sp. NBRC 101677]
MAWLEPLTSWPGVLDVAVHVDPVPAQAAAARIRRRRVRMESGRRLRAERGSLEDPLMEAVSQDAGDLADQVARGESRLFTTTVLITVHATSLEHLQAQVAGVQAHAASMLMDTHVMTWRQQQGWTSTLPIGADASPMRRIMDTAALAAACPLAGADLPAPLPVLESSSLSQSPGRQLQAWPGESGAQTPDSDEVFTQIQAAGGAAGLSAPVLVGLNLFTGGVVDADRWQLDNHNQVVLARSGAGKSYAVKLSILREMYNGVRVCVIDPEREYLELARQVDGLVLELGAPGIRVNPLALPSGDPDAFTRRCLFVQTLVDVMLQEALRPQQRAVLDEAVIATYAGAGIDADPATWSRPAPSLEALLDVLAQRAGQSEPSENAGNSGNAGKFAPAGNLTAAGAPGAASTTGMTGRASGNGRGNGNGRDDGAAQIAADLMARIAPWVNGSYQGLFTTGREPGHDGSGVEAGLDVGREQLVVWTTRLLADELRPVGMLLAIDAIWRTVDRPSGERSASHDGLPGAHRRQLVVVDEASTLLSEPAGARFLARLAKTARKRRAGLMLITPDVVDLIGSELGQVVLANSATLLLLRQAPQAIDDLTRACALSPGEAQFLTAARRGQGLFLAGARVPVDIIASPAEHAIACAPPEELHELYEAEDVFGDQGEPDLAGEL